MGQNLHFRRYLGDLDRVATVRVRTPAHRHYHRTLVAGLHYGHQVSLLADQIRGAALQRQLHRVEFAVGLEFERVEGQVVQRDVVLRAVEDADDIDDGVAVVGLGERDGLLAAVQDGVALEGRRSRRAGLGAVGRRAAVLRLRCVSSA